MHNKPILFINSLKKSNVIPIWKARERACQMK